MKKSSLINIGVLALGLIGTLLSEAKHEQEMKEMEDDIIAKLNAEDEDEEDGETE